MKHNTETKQWFRSKGHLTLPTINANGKVIDQHPIDIWLISEDGNSNTGKGVAYVPMHFSDAEAKSKLIEQAPALLAMLKEIEALSPFRASEKEKLVRAYEKARGVISRAEGKGEA